MAELVPIRDPRERFLPCQKILVVVGENSVDLPDDGDALLLIELLVVDLQKLINTGVFEARDVVAVLRIGECGAERCLRIRKGQARPCERSQIKLLFRRKLKERLRCKKPQAEPDPDFPE